MDPINGVSIEKYAELCALMAETDNDKSREFAIAEANGVPADDWVAAKAGWTARMSDPADMGKTALAFMPLYRVAQENMRGGGEPCALETYSRLYAIVYFGGGAPSKRDVVTAIVEREGHTYPQWIAYNTYWGEVVGEEKSPRFDMEKARTFGKIVKGIADGGS
ncbi:MAG: hypothetical protein EON90_12600 [Brevundimonas sp.]|nr:MAG: hypothetical protein EON90_12600 [Brevundimonas sp.]